MMKEERLKGELGEELTRGGLAAWNLKEKVNRTAYNLAETSILL